MSKYKDEFKKTPAEDGLIRPIWDQSSAIYNTTNLYPSLSDNQTYEKSLGALFNQTEFMIQTHQNIAYYKTDKKKIPPIRPEDSFDSAIDKMKYRIVKLLDNSYQGKIKESIRKFEKIKADLENVLPDSGIARFDLCIRIGTLYYRGHMNKDSREWLKKAEECSQGIPREGNEELFKKMHSTLGDILIKTEEYNDAKIHLEKAWEILERLDPPDLKFKSWNRANMAQLLSEGPEPNYEQAEKLFYESLDYKMKLNNYRLVGLNYDYLAEFYIKRGEDGKALECVEKALEWSSKFGERYYLVARHLRNRAIIYFNKSEILKSQKDYKEALSILKEQLSEGNALSTQYEKEYLEKYGVIWQFEPN